MSKIEQVNMNLVKDININIEVELGSTRRPIKDILSFTPGAVVELDNMANSPVKIFANGKFVGTGEVVVIDDVYGVRILTLNKE